MRKTTVKPLVASTALIAIVALAPAEATGILQPPVNLPRVPQAPSLPRLDSLPKLPKLPDGPSGLRLRSPAGGGSGSPLGSGAGSGGGPVAPLGGSGPGGSVGAGPSNPLGQQQTPARTEGDTSREAAERRAERRRRARQRDERERKKLKAQLEPLRGCFGGLSRQERRVVTMRFGKGGQRGWSRKRIARRLRTSSGNVRRLERRGAETLRGLDRATGCGGGGTSSGGSGDVVVMNDSVVNRLDGPAPGDAMAGVRPAAAKRLGEVRELPGGERLLAAKSAERVAGPQGDGPVGGLASESGFPGYGPPSDAGPPRANILASKPSGTPLSSDNPVVLLLLVAALVAAFVLWERRYDGPRGGRPPQDGGQA